MAENLLEVRNLVVNVEDKEILHNINLDIKPGETHVLMGPNGAGKSTLGYALMGNPKYTVKGGSINFAGEDITKLASLGFSIKSCRISAFFFSPPLKPMFKSRSAYLLSICSRAIA